MELLHLLPIGGLAATFAGMSAVMLWRVRETRTAVSLPRIVLPPLAMSTGFLMFLDPAPRVAWSWALGAFLLGALVLSYPLVRTSILTRVGGEIRLHRSRALLLVLLGLAALRLLLRDQLDDVVTPLQTAGLFFILAFGMVLRWRAGMLRQYRSLLAEAPLS